jgi:hypothetical protein
MNPPIANQTFNAVIQIIIAVSVLASIAAPFAGKGRFAAVLHILTGLPGDITKVSRGAIQLGTGVETVPTEVAPVAASRVPVPPLPILAALVALASLGIFGVELSACKTLPTPAAVSSTEQTIVNDVEDGLTYAQRGCVELQALLGSSDPAIVDKVCNIVESLAPNTARALEHHAQIIHAAATVRLAEQQKVKP